MTLRERLYEKLQQVAQEMARCWAYVMEQENGVNQKTSQNTLIDSDAYKSVLGKVQKDNLDLVTVLMNEYVRWIEKGRKPHIKRVPFDALVRWAEKNGIPTDNKTIYSIQSAIWRDGIPPRNITYDAVQRLDTLWNDWADEIFETLCEDLDDFFFD